MKLIIAGVALVVLGGVSAVMSLLLFMMEHCCEHVDAEEAST